MTRIVIVCAQASGGVRHHVGQTARLLSNSYEVHVIAPQSVLEGLDCGQAATHPLAIGSRPSSQDPATVRALKRAFSRYRPDAVHAHGLRAGALSSLALMGFPSRFVVTLHNMPVGSRLIRGIGQTLLSVIARRADVVMAVSPDLRQWAQRAGARVTRVATVPAPWSDTNVHSTHHKLPRESGKSQYEIRKLRQAILSLSSHRSYDLSGEVERVEPLIILTCSRLAPQKGMGELLDALRILRTCAPRPFVWVIAGEGPQRDLLEQARDQESLPLVLLGHRIDIPDLMTASDLIVSTSLWEGQSLTLQEALHAHKPLITTDVGGSALTSHGGATLCEPTGESLAEAVLSVITTDDALAQAARKSASAAQLLPTEADLRDELISVLRLDAST
ncbi:glycosyltransferase [Actinomyces vulturis]|uniref:glycosyltransferase n=1 Tax=Actinomyces vulturis TaxID=1857645 RepID=UPI000830B7A2|nr:glycosyltransferase [Actinomyces vulturis]